MATIAPDNEPTLNIREQLVRIDKMQVALQKAQAEIIQIKQTTRFEPWRVYTAAFASAAAVYGAVAALLKLLG